jgi:hypothetical protein
MSRHSTLSRLTTLLALALCLSSCMTTNLPPISAAGGSFQPLPDEIELWETARDEEEKLLDKVDLYDDPLLEKYLEDVVARINPPGMAANPELRYRVRVIEDPTLNAFAYPHGSLYVHTGLLARLENEDQLATVLGHEMSHVENRHMVRYQRSIHNKQVALSAVAIAAAVWAASEQSDAWADGDWGRAASIVVLSEVLVGLGLQLAFLASVNGYGRDLELEADHGGFAKLQRAGYDLDQSPRVYELLQEDHGDSSQVEVFFFGSHPNLTLRVQNAKTWIAGHPAGPDAVRLADAQDFQRRLRMVVRDDARLNIQLGRLGIAEDELLRALALMPDDAEVHYLFGRLHLARAEQNPAEAPALEGQARQSLQRAIDLDAKRPDPWRELGLLAYDDKDWRGACRSFQRYLELADPQEAEDHEELERFRDYMKELQRDGACP